MAVLGAHTHGSPNLNQLAPAYSAPAHILVPVSLPERERERKRGRGERVLPHRPTPEILAVHPFMQPAQLKMRQLSSVGVQKSRQCFSFCLISVVNIGSYFWTPPCCKSPIEKNNWTNSPRIDLRLIDKVIWHTNDLVSLNIALSVRSCGQTNRKHNQLPWVHLPDWGRPRAEDFQRGFVASQAHACNHNL